MKMDLGLLYAVVAGVAAIVNLVLLLRVRDTQYKEMIDRSFCRLLGFFMLFAIEDSTWGLLMSTVVKTSRTGFVIFTYGFHLFAAFSAFFWAGYTARYISDTGISKKAIDVIRTGLLATQLVIIGTNLFTGRFFVIDAECVYHTGPFRTTNFIIQMTYYVILLLYGLIVLTNRKDDLRTKNGLTIIMFSIVPLVFGFGQLQFPDAPMYSLGFMMSAVFIYTTTVTKQREDYQSMMFEEDKAQLMLQLAQKESDAKTRFLFNMSHDIRTPMNAIVGFTELAKKNIKDERYLKECLDKITVSSQHLLTLINEVLDMSHIESGKMVIDMKPADLVEDQKKLITIAEELGLGKSIRFTYNIDGIRDSHVRYDVLRINQVLLNVLSNSFKYTPSGRTVDYKVEQIDSPDDQHNTYRFTIADTGQGMSEEFVKNIFKEFEREQTATASGIEGTGLGMSIVKKLTDLMDGTISITSEKGKGTTTVLTFTFEKYEAADVEAPDNVENLDTSFLKGKRILLVEDNPMNIEIAQDLFEDLEMIVETATDGKYAVEKVTAAEPGRYDYIFMDVQMPVMGGYEATGIIRAMDSEWTKKVPIFAMTANAFEDDRQNSLRAGMNEHLIKPIDPQAIVSAMYKYRH